MNDQISIRKREISINRTFDAPRKLVFDAFTAPDKIGQWWGPDGFTTTTKSMNFEVGGEWIFTMHGSDGTDYPNRILYTKIKKPELLMYNHFASYENDGKPPHFKQTITFKKVSDQTKVTLKLVFPTEEARNNAAKFGAVEGGQQTLGRLTDFLEKQPDLR